MKNKLLFFLLLCLNPFLSPAQNSYLPGTIIIQQGDTLKGLILYKRWNRNPTDITFKANQDSDKQTFQATDIQSFNVAGEFYLGAIVEVDRSSRVTNNLEYNGKLNLRKDTVFLRILFDGPKTLYQYKDYLNKEHFFIRNNGQPEYLGYKRFRRPLDNNNDRPIDMNDPQSTSNHVKLLENKQYTTQLLNYLGDCTSITNKIQDIEYTKVDIGNLFTTYYDCSDNIYSLNTFKSRLKKQNHFDIILGLTLTNLTINSSLFDYEYLEDLDFGLSFGPAFGIAHTTTYPGNFGRWQFRKELLISSYNYEDTYEDFTNQDNYTNYEIKVGGYTTRLAMILRYNINIGSFRPHFSAGLNLNYAPITNERVIRQKLGNTERTTVRKAIPSLNQGGFGAQFGIGIEKGRFGFNANYQLKGDGSGTAGVVANINQFNFLVTYSLKKNKNISLQN